MIIDMYCKCGCLEKVFEVFSGLDFKGIFIWNCMIGGLVMYGRGEDVIDFFKDMEKKMVFFDSIFFLNVFNVCVYSGLVDIGCYYFKYMI